MGIYLYTYIYLCRFNLIQTSRYLYSVSLITVTVMTKLSLKLLVSRLWKPRARLDESHATGLAQCSVRMGGAGAASMPMEETLGTEAREMSHAQLLTSGNGCQGRLRKHGVCGHGTAQRTRPKLPSALLSGSGQFHGAYHCSSLLSLGVQSVCARHF